MNAQKIWGFAVAVLVSALVSGCGAVATRAPLGTVAAGGGGGGVMVTADSAPPYRPAAIPEEAHGYHRDRGSVSLVATRVLHR